MARGKSLSFSSLKFWEGIILLYVALTYSPATALKCMVCGWKNANPPYNAPCDAPEEMDCANEPDAKEPFACAVNLLTDIETGNPTGKILDSRCRIQGNGPVNCWLSNIFDERPLTCWCDVDLCEHPPTDIWEKAVKSAKETIAEEKKMEAEKRRSSSATSLFMFSTSWTTLVWTRMAPAIILNLAVFWDHLSLGYLC